LVALLQCRAKQDGDFYVVVVKNKKCGAAVFDFLPKFCRRKRISDNAGWDLTSKA
jgi:hypothetical protein